MNKLILTVGVFFSAIQAQAIHYGCISSPVSPLVAYTYENESPPLSYVEKMQYVDGSKMFGNTPDVVYTRRPIIQTGHTGALIGDSKAEIIVFDKENPSKVILKVPYLDPDDIRLEPSRVVQLENEAIFDGKVTKTIVYDFCGDD